MCSSLSSHNEKDTPYHKLLTAVLKSAMQDIASQEKGSALYQDAYRWIYELPPYTGMYAQYIFSISSICEHLDVDKQRIQRHVKEHYVAR